MEAGEKQKIEIHKRAENYGIEFLAELRAQGVELKIVGPNSLHISGQMTKAQIEAVKVRKKMLISALSPKCKNCGLAMNLIESAQIWFCPLGCGSIENVKKL